MTSIYFHRLEICSERRANMEIDQLLVWFLIHFYTFGIMRHFVQKLRYDPESQAVWPWPLTCWTQINHKQHTHTHTHTVMDISCIGAGDRAWRGYCVIVDPACSRQTCVQYSAVQYSRPTADWAELRQLSAPVSRGVSMTTYRCGGSSDVIMMSSSSSWRHRWNTGRYAEVKWRQRLCV